MDIPLPSESLYTPTSATGFAALLLVILALNDFFSPSAEDEIGSLYWSAQAPLRAAFYFLATGGIYLWKFGLEESKKKERIAGSAGSVLAMRESVCNSFVFSFAFMEMLLWFWVRRLCSWYTIHADSPEDIHCSERGSKRIIVEEGIEAKSRGRTSIIHYRISFITPTGNYFRLHHIFMEADVRISGAMHGIDYGAELDLITPSKASTQLSLRVVQIPSIASTPITSRMALPAISLSVPQT